MKASFWLSILVFPITVWGQAPNQYLMQSGLQLSESCIGSNVLQKKIEDATLAAVQKGLACLEAMPGEQVKSHASRIRSLLSNPTTSPVVSCKELDSDRLAEASFPELNVAPYIYVNDSIVQPNLDGIMFHELFHNIGYPHGANKIEYAYTCAECCFPESGGTIKELACNLCMRRDGILDFQYVRSVSEVFIGVERPQFALQRFIDYLKRNPRSANAKFFLREALQKGYPALALAVENDEGVARFLDQLFEGMEALLDDPTRTWRSELPHILEITYVTSDPSVQWALNEFYVAIEELGLQTSEKTSLVFLK